MYTVCRILYATVSFGFSLNILNITMVHSYRRFLMIRLLLRSALWVCTDDAKTDISLTPVLQ